MPTQNIAMLTLTIKIKIKLCVVQPHELRNIFNETSNVEV